MHLSDSAETNQGLPPRFFAAQTVSQAAFDVHDDMGFKFVGKSVAIHPAQSVVQPDPKRP
jgi:hypothetical protein